MTITFHHLKMKVNGSGPYEMGANGGDIVVLSIVFIKSPRYFRTVLITSSCLSLTTQQ